MLGLVALVLSSDDPDDPVNAAIKAATDPLLVGVLQQLEVELSLLRSRVRFIAGLQALHAAQRPLPGPGRIDAFDGIRDLVFPRSDAIAADSPVSYPELWLVNQTYWLHWDGNTNSLIQRNIGQALGQGAALRSGRAGQLPFAGSAREHPPARDHRPQADPARVARPALRPDRCGEGRAGARSFTRTVASTATRRPA